jgi:hypothetical protein
MELFICNPDMTPMNLTDRITGIWKPLIAQKIIVFVDIRILVTIVKPGMELSDIPFVNSCVVVGTGIPGHYLVLSKGVWSSCGTFVKSNSHHT